MDRIRVKLYLNWPRKKGYGLKFNPSYPQCAFVSRRRRTMPHLGYLLPDSYLIRNRPCPLFTREFLAAVPYDRNTIVTK